MPVDFGRNLKVGIAEEASYNETYVQPTVGLYVEEMPHRGIIQQVNVHYTSGEVMQKLDEHQQGIKLLQGSLQMLTWKEQLGWLMKNLLGTVGTNIISAGPFYKHVFTPSITTPKSIRLLKMMGNRQFQLTGVGLTRLQLDFIINQPLMLNFDFTGADFANAAVGAAPTFAVVASGSEPWYKVKSSAWNINGITDWNNVKLTIESLYPDDVELNYNIGFDVKQRQERSAEDEAPFKVTAIAKKVHQGITEYNLYTAFTTLEAYYRDGIVDTSAYHLGINLGRCKVLNHEFIPAGKGMVEETLELKAFIESKTYYGNNDFNITVQDKQSTPA